jgi:GNAT superfamily N-acetyltransferase
VIEIFVLPPNESHPLRTQAHTFLRTVDWQEPDRKPGYDNELEEVCAARTLYVGVDKGRVVATALIRRLPPKTPTYFLSGVAVAPERQGQGLAKAILKQIMLDYAGGLVYLTAYPHNHGFWLHMGWSPSGPKNLFLKELK